MHTREDRKAENIHGYKSREPDCLFTPWTQEPIKRAFLLNTGFLQRRAERKVRGSLREASALLGQTLNPEGLGFRFRVYGLGYRV